RGRTRCRALVPARRARTPAAARAGRRTRPAPGAATARPSAQEAAPQALTIVRATTRGTPSPVTVGGAGYARRRAGSLRPYLQQLHLDRRGARVDRSAINLELYARRGRILGTLFCAVTHARVGRGRAAAAMNHRLNGRPLRVMSARTIAKTAQAPPQPTCSVLD